MIMFFLHAGVLSLISPTLTVTAPHSCYISQWQNWWCFRLGWETWQAKTKLSISRTSIGRGGTARSAGLMPRSGRWNLAPPRTSPHYLTLPSIRSNTGP